MSRTIEFITAVASSDFWGCKQSCLWDGTKAFLATWDTESLRPFRQCGHECRRRLQYHSFQGYGAQDTDKKVKKVPEQKATVRTKTETEDSFNCKKASHFLETVWLRWKVKRRKEPCKDCVAASSTTKFDIVLASARRTTGIQVLI